MGIDHVQQAYLLFSEVGAKLGHDQGQLVFGRRTATREQRFEIELPWHGLDQTAGLEAKTHRRRPELRPLEPRADHAAQIVFTVERLCQNETQLLLERDAAQARDASVAQDRELDLTRCLASPDEPRRKPRE